MAGGHGLDPVVEPTGRDDARPWRHSRCGPLLAVVLAAVAAGWFLLQARSPTGTGLDARVYRDAARTFLGSGDIYAGRFEDLPFTYPPFAALALSPLAVLPEGEALVLMSAASAAALVAVVRWCQQYAADGEPGAWWTTVALAAAAALVVQPVGMTLGLGQVNLLLLALVVGVDLRATRGAGVGAGVATAVKVAPGLLVLAQGVRGDWAALRRGVLTVVGLTAAVAAIVPDATRHYFGSLLWDSSRPGVLDDVENQSLRGLVERHVPGHPLVLLALACAVLVLGAWAVRVHRHDAFAALTAAAVTGLLVSPVSWSHHWVWVLPVVAVGVGAGRRSPLLWSSALLLVATVATDVLWPLALAPLISEDLYVIAGLLWLATAALPSTARTTTRVQVGSAAPGREPRAEPDDKDPATTAR